VREPPVDGATRDNGPRPWLSQSWPCMRCVGLSSTGWSELKIRVSAVRFHP